jgi:Zn-dependent protease with chaperone function
MTFALRCLSVSLAFFLIFYTLLSVVVRRGWRCVQRLASHLSARRMADLLFLMRILPAVAALVICCAFVVPSFLLLEPRVSAEPVGEIPLMLGLCCMALFVIGLYDATRTSLRTSQAVQNWLKDARELPAQHAVPVFQIRPTVPSLTLTGWCSPKVLLSSSAAAVLCSSELNAALKHEFAHARRKDNLKKLLFRLVIFPGMSQLEAAWGHAGEMAADDEAVSCAREALDLASALIKLSRLAPVQSSLALTTALLQEIPSSVNARSERLVAWDPMRASQTTRSIAWYLRPAVAVSCVALFLTYGMALRETHLLTEWLVR